MLEFFVVFTIIWNQISSSLLVLNNQDYVKLANNKLSNSRKILANYEANVASLLLMIYIATNHSGGLSPMGLSLKQVDIPKLIFIGSVATGYLLLIFVRPFFLYPQQRKDEEEKQKIDFELRGYASYKTFWERFAFLGAIWLGVIVEELVYRGYLILFLGVQTGTFFPWIILSIGLSIGVHFYQGITWRRAFSHAFFAIVFIIVVLITRNIIVAIIPHLIYNTIWFLIRWIRASRAETIQAQPIS